MNIWVAHCSLEGALWRLNRVSGRAYNAHGKRATVIQRRIWRRDDSFPLGQIIFVKRLEEEKRKKKVGGEGIINKMVYR